MADPKMDGLQWKIPSRNGGTPIYGNPHIVAQYKPTRSWGTPI